MEYNVTFTRKQLKRIAKAIGHMEMDFDTVDKNDAELFSFYMFISDLLEEDEQQ